MQGSAHPGQFNSRCPAVVGLQFLPSEAKQAPPEDRHEGRSRETIYAPTVEPVVVGNQDHEPRDHHNPVDDV